MYPTVLDNIATQTVVSSHFMNNIIRTIAHTKTIRKQKIAQKTKRDLLHVLPNNFHNFRS